MSATTPTGRQFARDMNAGLVKGAGIEGQPLYKKFGMRSPIVDDYYPTSTDYHSLQVKFDRRFARGSCLLPRTRTARRSITQAIMAASSLMRSPN